MGKASRDKGKRGEREACEILRPIFPEVRRRAMQARGGAEGADLEGTGRYHVEVGVGASISAHAKWEQANEDSAIEQIQSILAPTETHPKTPIALTRKDRGEWLVTMEAGAWVERERRIRELEARVHALEHPAEGWLLYSVTTKAQDATGQAQENTGRRDDTKRCVDPGARQPPSDGG